MLDTLLVPVREKIGPIATPDYIQNAPGLPKTRSGKLESSRDWDGLSPVVANVWMKVLKRAGISQHCYQLIRGVWVTRQNHEASTPEDCSERP